MHVARHCDGDIAPRHVVVDAQNEQQPVIDIELRTQSSDLFLDVRTLMRLRPGSEGDLSRVTSAPVGLYSTGGLVPSARWPGLQDRYEIRHQSMVSVRKPPGFDL